MFIDAVSVRTNMPVWFQGNVGDDNGSLESRRLLPSLQLVYGTLSVSSQAAGTIDIKYRPNNCSNLMPVTIRQNITNVNKSQK